MSIRPPRVRMITFHSCHRLIYCRRFVQYRTLLCLASSSVSIQPHMRFLSVSASVCVRLPSDSTSRWTPLSFTNSSYCQVCSGLSPPSYRPCWAHNKNQLSTLPNWLWLNFQLYLSLPTLNVEEPKKEIYQAISFLINLLLHKVIYDHWFKLSCRYHNLIIH